MNPHRSTYRTGNQTPSQGRRKGLTARPSGRSPILPVLLGLALLLTTASASVLAEEEGVVTRSLPANVDCDAGATFTVTLTVTPFDGTSSWVLDEQPPEDADVSDVDSDNSGEYNEDQNAVKWISLNGNAATHSYNVTVPAGTSQGEVLDFSGEFRFNPEMDERAPVVGDTSVDCAPPCPGGPEETFHPHDAGQNGVLDDDDLFALIDDWRLSDDGDLDDLLFAGIDAWKMSPGSYC